MQVNLFGRYFEVDVVMKYQQRLEGHSGSVNSVAFSPDGKLLASGSSDKRIGLWDISDPSKPRLIKRLEGHSGSVNSVVFSPDGKLLASGSSDKRIGLWNISDPSKPKLIKRLEGHSNYVLSVSFSPDGRLLASGSSDKRIGLWDISNPSKPKPITWLKGRSKSFYSVAFSPDGNLLASGSSNKRIGLWDISDPKKAKLIKQLEGHSNYVLSVAFSPDGKLLASGSVDRRIGLWDIVPISVSKVYRKMSLEERSSKMRAIERIEKLASLGKRFNIDPVGVLREASDEGLLIDLLKILVADKEIEQIDATSFKILREARCEKCEVIKVEIDEEEAKRALDALIGDELREFVKISKIPRESLEKILKELLPEIY